MTQPEVLAKQLEVAKAQRVVIEGNYVLQCDQNDKQQVRIKVEIEKLPVT